MHELGFDDMECYHVLCQRYLTGNFAENFHAPAKFSVFCHPDSTIQVLIGAELLIKATKVDGVYSSDPVKNNDAIRYETLNYDDVIERKLNVMDTTAVVLCRENKIPLRILDMTKPGVLLRAAMGENEGTLVN